VDTHAKDKGVAEIAFRLCFAFIIVLPFHVRVIAECRMWDGGFGLNGLAMNATLPGPLSHVRGRFVEKCNNL
jgi:hypothetical protein